MARNSTVKNNNKKHPFVRLKRKVKLSYLRILRIDDPPERIARGAAIGVLMGILPTFGTGAILSLGFAFLLRANKAAAVLGSFIMNPVTSTFFWTMSIVLGSLILQEDSSSIIETVRGKNLLNGIGWAYLVFLVGNVIISAVFSVGTYFLIKSTIIKRRAHRAAKFGKAGGRLAGT